uniref:Uncharacterized protein n=1 Tax=Eucampia antarctica TaxID=49252 RepID=A0A7S2R374_9STRA|mmetsp:Transcript_1585/g.1513  ORF Transcript_1585/g.1513 Transcript_1585/m.1513 type:complete len:286 (+) Transcript_1585:54-911(+)|eukprot:CAMPEP_0197836738 /NCGR_PEP_ID=MMETSP1437-20131217/29884_1 /TAXON_ID=49252 ORGANISM="Eucampia antarctica, Strain CCMP1452" /NCGR_SAMPLE_ID=MMETSP1437 /ASSEMBLY_ACC=CAM_ASM_001096 /LENGTH=285 /DNA_ID=CAMNT_0043443159 /DNA_START=49 /DNA_END=906 /DNA_ORIENTATION=+
MRNRLISFTVAGTASLSNAFLTHTYCSSFVAPLLLSNRVRSTLATDSVNSNGVKSTVDNNDSRLNAVNESAKEQECINTEIMPDKEYPGTSIVRLNNVRARLATLTMEDLSGDWTDVRRKILWAGGLKDLPDAIPGQGYTGHSFNDYNHVDLTTMNGGVSDNENDGAVKGIMIGNQLGAGIRIASDEELGPGGSWSTCAMGCNQDPPSDVAHIQFRSRIAFKLVWVPNKNLDTFVLVDDDGKELARGKPKGNLPRILERQMNYRLMAGSKYATVADAIVSEVVTG